MEISKVRLDGLHEMIKRHCPHVPAFHRGLLKSDIIGLMEAHGKEAYSKGKEEGYDEGEDHANTMFDAMD